MEMTTEIMTTSSTPSVIIMETKKFSEHISSQLNDTNFNQSQFELPSILNKINSSFITTNETPSTSQNHFTTVTSSSYDDIWSNLSSSTSSFFDNIKLSSYSSPSDIQDDTIYDETIILDTNNHSSSPPVSSMTLINSTINSTLESSISDISSWIQDFSSHIYQSSPLDPLNLPYTLENEDSNFLNETCTYMFENNFTNYENYSNCTDQVNFTLGPTKNYWFLLLLVFPVFTVFGNVLVILSVKRERSLQNVTNYFIVSLAVADLLVAAAVMPFGVYLLVNRLDWGLPPVFCDVYIAMDVTCSTSSICNLVAISIDRFIAVTRPIKYAKHKGNTRVWLTIVFVWVFSGLVGSPIVLGLNTPETDSGEDYICLFHNKYFVLFSSLCSFYIPCAILVVLYYRIFKVIRERAKKAVASRKANAKGNTVIENVAQTRKLAETALGGSGPSNVPTPSKSPNLDEKFTTGSGSQEDGEELDEKEEGDLDMEAELEDGSPDSADECHIIANNQVATAFVLASVRVDERGPLGRGQGLIMMEPNGNHDSGYAPSNLEESPLPVPEALQISPKHSLLHPNQCKRNGLGQIPKKIEEGSVIIGEEASSSGSSKKPSTSAPPPTGSRFTIGKVHKSSRKKREKSSAKRERKATKTLAIVLGLFLACWLPFFTCNIMDALCSLMSKDDSCNPGPIAFLLTTWLGYINSSFNPAIYTVFNPEFRKAFKKLLGFAP